MTRKIIVVAVALLATQAWAVNKCTGPDGKVSYQAAPCSAAASGEALKLQPVPESAPEDVQFNNAVSQGRVMVGMSATQVRRAWGTPTKVNASVGSYGRHEQWIYNRGGFVSQYVYVQNGVVSSIQSPE